MRIKFTACALYMVLILSGLSSAAQDKVSQSTEGHSAVPCFGELASGYVTIAEALDDSLSFTDPWINERMHIVSFNLALKCNGNVVKYMENKSGNKLTPEMKEAILKLHQNCSLNFDGIKSKSRTKDVSGKFTETKHKGFKITLK